MSISKKNSYRNRRARAAGWVAATFVAALMLNACASGVETDSETNEVVIGVIEPLTGGSAAYGQAVLKGVQLAADHINEQGGVLGKQIVIRSDDNATDNAQTIALLRRYAGDGSIIGVIGPIYSGNFFAGAPIAETEEVLWASAGSTAPWPSGLPNEWTYRNTAQSSYVVEEFLNAVLPALGATTVGSINATDNAAYAPIAEHASEVIDAMIGVTEVAKETVTTGTRNFGPQITRLLDANPDVVMVNLDTEDGAAFMKQARKRGLESDLIAPHNGFLDTATIGLSAGAAEGIISPSHFDPTDKENKWVTRVVDGWKEKYGEPLTDFNATYGYDLLWTFKQAMEDAGTTTDREAVRNAFGQIQDLCLSSGCYSWDGPGDPSSKDVFPMELTADGLKPWMAS